MGNYILNQIKLLLIKVKNVKMVINIIKRDKSLVFCICFYKEVTPTIPDNQLCI